MERIRMEQPFLTYIIGIEPDAQTCSDWPLLKSWLDAAAAFAPDAPEIVGENEVVWVIRRFEGFPVPVARPCGVVTCGKSEGVMLVQLLGGVGMSGWLAQTFEKAVDWARDEGCTAFRAWGRKGWQRALAPLGFVPVGVDGGFQIYEKALG